MTNKDPTANYSGIIFDATGTTLYGYRDGEYGSIDENTGEFQTVLVTGSSLFNTSGDLAEGIETVAVPEPTTFVLMLTALLTIAFFGYCCFPPTI